MKKHHQSANRSLWVVLFITAHLMLTACQQATEEPIDFSKYATPEEKAQALAVQFPGLSVSVAQGDEIIWEWSGGFADIEQQIPASTDTLFNIYSVSKMISGMAFARLQYEGTLDIDTRIRTIDPSLPAHYEAITLAHLLSHRSGIRHYRRGSDWKNFADRRCTTTQDALTYFSQDPLEFEPGSDQLYSTFGMVLASHVLVLATQANNFVTAINDPLNTDYPFELDGADIVKATPYRAQSEGFQAVSDLNAACKYAGGGFVASSKQLALTGAQFAGGGIVPVDQLSTMLTNETSEGDAYRYAMSTGEAPQLGGLYAVMRGGATGGRGLLLVLLDAELSIALVGNAEGNSADVSAFAVAIAESFLPDMEK